MRELSMKELELVSGGTGIPGAVVGAVGGASMYVGQAITTGQGSFTGLAGATAAGAIAGAFGPIGKGAMQVAASTILANQVGFYSGMAGGLVQSAGEAAGTDYNAAGSNYN